jgi:hypothetical protein
MSTVVVEERCGNQFRCGVSLGSDWLGRKKLLGGVASRDHDGFPLR